MFSRFHQNMLLRRVIVQQAKHSVRRKHVRVACASGFWGDTSVSSLKVISNAGGLNPTACAEALRKAMQSEGVYDMKVATVTGDDLSGSRGLLDTEQLVADDGKPLSVKDLVSVNAYLGAEPIKTALDEGADIVITGRCVDSALALGPLMHVYDWEPTDLQALATGSVAGHLIECGAQCTGGIFTDWWTIPKWHRMGFPIVEFEEGSGARNRFRVTKPKGSGGRVSAAMVAEQLVYEIGDPANYILPDVSVDFRNVTIKQSDRDVVTVNGAKGLIPSNDFKVTATYMDGYRCTAVCPVIGPRAAQKGRATAEAILNRCRDIFKVLKLEDFSRTNVHILGTGESYGPQTDETGVDCRETVIWLGVEHRTKQALEIFSREIAPAGTGMAPGLTGIAGGRPTVMPVLKHRSFLVPKKDIQVEIVGGVGITLIAYARCIFGKAEISIDGRMVTSCKFEGYDYTDSVKDSASDISQNLEEVPLGSKTYTLEQLAYARSGDKGDTLNIGVVARKSDFYGILKKHLTAEKVANYFAHYMQNTADIERYELPGIYALNFVLPRSLGGGGIASLRCDPQGKAMGQMLLEMKLEGLPDLNIDA